MKSPLHRTWTIAASFCLLILAGSVCARGEPDISGESATESNPSPKAPTPLRQKRKALPAKAPAPEKLVTVDEWLRNGPKEPLIPPEYVIELTPAPGSTLKDTPLIPAEFEIVLTETLPSPAER